MHDHIRHSLNEAKAALDALLANEQTIASIARAAEALVGTFKAGGRVYSCGNGGSMSDAVHFAEELTGRYRDNRPGLPALAISDVGHLTCVANDFGYEQVFARFLESHARAGDCLLAISTSGSSANVIKAAEAAKARAAKVIALTGKAGSKLEALADICICTPGGRYADRVQELHIKVIHILIELVERGMFGKS
ncbi:MAG: D-sedoheptulose 7-phosphate isomerase [Alphaproteobacteria bacterium]|nr:D-sedoheptulose 7-phosphate isomerase [Alphaproteobacteria bacterium]